MLQNEVIEIYDCDTVSLTQILKILIDFSLSVKAATLIFISGRGFICYGKSGFIYNLAKS